MTELTRQQSWPRLVEFSDARFALWFNGWQGEFDAAGFGNALSSHPAGFTFMHSPLALQQSVDIFGVSPQTSP
jgi:hypothetical protein